MSSQVLAAAAAAAVGTTTTTTTATPMVSATYMTTSTSSVSPASNVAYRSSIPCRYFYRSGKCTRGDKCQFSHAQKRESGQPGVPKSSSTESQASPSEAGPSRLSALATDFVPSQSLQEISEDRSRQEAQSSVTSRQALKQSSGDAEACGICMEVPVVFAQHTGCNHYFCVPCIQQWRKQRSVRGEQRQSNSKACPTCRSRSNFTFVTAEPVANQQRLAAIERHRKRLKQIPCRHFTKSLGLHRSLDSRSDTPAPAAAADPNADFSKGKKKATPYCVFGDDCLFQHSIDGKPYLFNAGFKDMKARRPGHVQKAHKRNPRRNSADEFDRERNQLEAMLLRLTMRTRLRNIY